MTAFDGANANKAPETFQQLLHWEDEVDDNADLQYGGITHRETAKTGHDVVVRKGWLSYCSLQ